MPLKRFLWIVTAAGWCLHSGCAQLSPTPRYLEAKPSKTTPASEMAQAAAALPPSAATGQVMPAQSIPPETGQPKLGPGDVIDVKVYQEDELTSHVRVSADGTVTLPLLGAVPVGGKTVEEASEYIRAALAQDYLVDPHVTLTLAEFAKKRFSVMGEVKQPGFYQIPDGEKINVLQALSMAGGFTPYSRGTRIQVKRVVNGNEVVLWVDAKAMARKKNIEPLEILPGDVITVNPNIF